GCMAECIRSILQGYKTKTFGRVKPFDRCPLRTKAGAGARVIEVSHDVIRLRPCCDEPRRRMRHFAPVGGMRQDAPHPADPLGNGRSGPKGCGGRKIPRFCRSGRGKDGAMGLFFRLPECYTELVKVAVGAGVTRRDGVLVYTTRRRQ